jgi:hypothetical protein
VSPGSLETWVLKSSKGSEQNYEKIWTRSFASAAWNLSWCPVLNYLTIGCEDGSIVPIKVSVDDPMTYDELKVYKVHKDTVVGSYIDGDKNMMYSIGEDKYLRVFDFKTKEITTNN